MVETVKVAYDVAQRASSDPSFMHVLVADPVEAVRQFNKSLNVEEASEVAFKARQLISALPGSEIVNLVKEILRNATNAFRLTIRLSQVLFYIGIVILVGLLAFELIGRILGTTSWQDVATTGIIGAVGIGTIVSSFILRPLGNIQNSVGNLSQVEIGFLSFIDRRQIMLQTKVSGDIAETKQLSDEIGKAASAAAKLIEDYCEYRTTEGTKK